MENEASISCPSGESSDPYDSSAAHHAVLIAGHNKWEWIFGVICISSVTLLITCSMLSLKMCSDEILKHLAVENLEVVICTTACISFCFAFYGIYTEHQYEIYMHSLVLALSLVFCWIGFVLDNSDCLYCFKLITNVAGSIMCACGFLLALKATHAPDWVEFRIIGVCDILTAMYNHLCYFLALVKFDSIFMVVFALYSAEFSYSFNTKMWWIYQVEIFAYAFFSWICARLSIFLENKCLIYGFYLVSSVYPAFIIYQLYLILISKQYGIVHYSIISFGILSIISKFYLIVQMHKCGQKFGHGLNKSSFKDLACRNSSNLLCRSRSAILF